MKPITRGGCHSDGFGDLQEPKSQRSRLPFCRREDRDVSRFGVLVFWLSWWWCFSGVGWLDRYGHSRPEASELRTFLTWRADRGEIDRLKIVINRWFLVSECLQPVLQPSSDMPSPSCLALWHLM